MASSSRGAVLAAILGNATITVAKFVAFAITGSGSMLSEGIHSVADTANQTLLFIGIRRSERPADDMFHYGYGADRYLYALLSAIPIPDPDAEIKVVEGLEGELPSPIHPPSGCRFRTRCPRAEDRCAAEEPEIRQVGDGHFVACHFPIENPVEIRAKVGAEN